MANFATLEDVIALWKPLTPEETTMVETLLPLVSDTIRIEARNVGRDFDLMIANDYLLASVAKSVTVDVVKRYINDNVEGPAMVQESQSALGYSVSGTFLSPGGGIFIKKSELARLGLRRQRFGALNIYGEA